MVSIFSFVSCMLVPDLTAFSFIIMIIIFQIWAYHDPTRYLPSRPAVWLQEDPPRGPGHETLLNVVGFSGRTGNLNSIRQTPLLVRTIQFVSSFLFFLPGLWNQIILPWFQAVWLRCPCYVETDLGFFSWSWKINCLWHVLLTNIWYVRHSGAFLE